MYGDVYVKCIYNIYIYMYIDIYVDRWPTYKYGATL